MIGTLKAISWGFTGEQFLWAYGTACLAAAAGIAHQWRRALGPAEDRSDPLPDLGLYELAMLSGGPRLAITSAAALLHRDGLLTTGPGARTLETAGELDETADPLERAVFETVGRDRWMTADELRRQLADCEQLRAMTAQLTSVGLLLDEGRSALLRRMWLVGGLLAMPGIARIAVGATEGAPVGVLLVMVGAVVLATSWLIGRRPVATTRGRLILERWRASRADLRRHPGADEGAMAAALFGGGALWLAAPEIASAFGIPREEEAPRRWYGGGHDGFHGGCSLDAGGGGCGGGCGGGGGGG
jgi:uncharacterized protein (TIGR04222 family)